MANEPVTHWHALDAAAVARDLETDPMRGLAQDEAARRLAAELARGAELASARNAAFSTLVVAELRALGARSGTKLVSEIGLLSNLHLFVVVAASFTLQIAIHHSPTLGRVFGIAPVSMGQCAPWIGLGCLPLLVLEARELWRRRASDEGRPPRGRRLRRSAQPLGEGGGDVKNVFVVLLLLALAAVAAGLGFAYSGLADVAATSPHWAVTRWVLSTTMENAVERQAREIAPAPFLDEPTRVQAGAVAYDAMCTQCHGAPGVEPGVVGQGLNPEPPDLAEDAEEWSPAELFWITKHGVRMTGMPAFGPTHSDAELWQIVALVKRLPDMSPAEYGRLADSRPEAEHEHPGERSRHRYIE